uniref:Trichohyalin-plectin-homology domain-containing protein n=1 Tax=Heliothis virescens TaxID=7102 RepID=A0A2A4JQK5_HELVI
MVGVMKPKNKQPVYFGHPFQFWKKWTSYVYNDYDDKDANDVGTPQERQREEMKAIVDVDDMKKLSDVVEYDLVHLQNEEEALIQELATKQEMEECGYCKEKDKKNKGYLEEIEKEKIRECQKALEREKIARGMRSTKEDEKSLKEVQKMQMEERKAIERSEQDMEMMWHHVLMENYNRKEYLERLAAQRKQQETLERRRCYDEQIASANKKRQELLRQEREKENRKFENMKKKMEQDHYEAIRKKKEQQETNRRNFIEGHEQKLMRIRNEKMRAREIDNGTIRINLQLEKQICIENHNRKKRVTSALEEESDKIADEWQQEAHNKTDEHLRQIEEEQRLCKEKAAQEYKRHIQTRNQELQLAKQERLERMERVKRVALSELQRKIDSANEELRKQIEYRHSLSSQIRENEKHLKAAQEYKRHIQTRNQELQLAKQERLERMERVKRVALSELQRKIDSANEELRKQIEYRHSLSSQIRENEKHLEAELINIENKDRTYTKKAAMFKDVMAARYASSSARTR